MLLSVVNWMRARYLMLQGQMDYAMMYLDRVSQISPLLAEVKYQTENRIVGFEEGEKGRKPREKPLE